MAKRTKEVLQFEKERETKNKVRFQENYEGEPWVDKLYVSKAKLKELGNPETITVTLEVVKP